MLGCYRRAAWANAEASFITDNFGQISRNKTSRTGWTVGGGAEWQFLPHWSVFLEYDYLASNETRALP
ncbi:MAG: hypothetical protein WCD59_19470, partial [Pseudolabrys sp.]